MRPLGTAGMAGLIVAGTILAPHPLGAVGRGTYRDAVADQAPTTPSSDEATISLPAVFRNIAMDELPPPVTAIPTATGTGAPSPTSGPTPAASETVPARTPGVPDCSGTTGDLGGFRFSLDGGVTLAPNAHRLANVAYTWDLDVDPRNPDAILEVHQGRVFRSLDAGCTFSQITTVPAGDWDRVVRAPSAPDLLVLTAVSASKLAFSEDGGERWTTEDLPDDVLDLAIDPLDPWHWTFVGREPQIFSRAEAYGRWTARPIPLDAGQGVIAASYAPSRPHRWMVASSTRGLYRSDDLGDTWVPASDGLFAPIGAPSEPTLSVVVPAITFAPSNPDIVYASVNQVGRARSLRGIWRSEDGGITWTRRLANGDAVGTGVVRLTAGTRVFVSPGDPDWTFFAFGFAYDTYGTDLYRSLDGLRTIDVHHFAGFYKVYTMAFAPAGTSVVFVGASSDIPSD